MFMSTRIWRQEHKEELASYRRKWYHSHKKQYHSTIVKTRRRNRTWLIDYKSKLKCETCGASHPAIIQFHHSNPSKKDGNIGAISQRGWSIEKIKREIAKCRVLCANCHFIFHWNEKNS